MNRPNTPITTTRYWCLALAALPISILFLVLAWLRFPFLQDLPDSRPWVWGLAIIFPIVAWLTLYVEIPLGPSPFRIRRSEHPQIHIVCCWSMVYIEIGVLLAAMGIIG